MTVRPETRYPGPTPWSRARWVLRARPVDYLLAGSAASASLPVVGKFLEPLGGATAMSIWGARVFPEIISAAAKSMLTPGIAEIKQRQRDQTQIVSRAALQGIVPAEDLDTAWPAPQRTPPLLKARQHRRLRYRSTVRYGDDPAQVLDVWRRDDLPAEPAPVLIFVPGGGWVHGSRILQGYALMSHLAEQGWICLSIDYRVAPNHVWPQHISDVKTAISWAHANVAEFGGDRTFIAVAGCSAGGHLAALAALTPADPDLEVGLPDGSDTSVDAVVGIYGRYDWEDCSTAERARFVDFLQKVVVKRHFGRHRDIYRDASPISRVHPGAPPFLIIHGTGDTVIPVAQARSFVERLRAVSGAAVGYIELPGAGHGFDMTDGARTGSLTKAIALFLNQTHRRRTVAGAEGVM